MYVSPFWRAIIALRPGVNCANTNDTLDGIRWDVPLPEGFMPPTQEEVETEMARISKKEIVAAEFKAAAGAPITYQGDQFVIDEGRMTSRSVEALLALTGGAAWPNDGGWPRVDGTLVAMSAGQFLAFAKAVSAHVVRIVRNERRLQAELAAANTVAEVDAIDPTAGWAE